MAESDQEKGSTLLTREMQSDRLRELVKDTPLRVQKEPEDLAFVWPHLVYMELICLLLTTVVLLDLSVGIFPNLNAPLEELASPDTTPNPMKAPWYFLGLQELLHYFPPMVAGVLVPGLVVAALIVIPYFNINIEGESLWAKDRKRRLMIVGIALVLFCVFLLVFDVIVALVPTILIGGLMLWSARFSPESPRLFHRWLASKPLSFWIMSWFLIELTILTVVGTFFRGPGWSWVLPWQSY